MILERICIPFCSASGSLHFPTYGALLVLAILAAICTILRLGRREGLDSGQLLDFSTWLLLVALVGAKVLMVVSDWGYYRQFPGRNLQPQHFSGGRSFLRRIYRCGPVCGLVYPGFIIFQFWKVVDVYAPAIALGQERGPHWLFCRRDAITASPPLPRWGVVFTRPYAATRYPECRWEFRCIPRSPSCRLARSRSLSFLMWRYSRKTRDGEIFVLILLFMPWRDFSWNSCEVMRTAGLSFIISCPPRSSLPFWPSPRQYGWLLFCAINLHWQGQVKAVPRG